MLAATSSENVELVRTLCRPGGPGRFFDLLDQRVEFDFTAHPAVESPDPILR